jgi:hypothetical protein
MRYAAVASTALAGYFFAASAVADDYDYEVGLTYGWGQTDFTSNPIVNGIPTPSLGVTTGSSESDNIDLSGTWYYSGLSDDDGPKSRAAFLSRASSISLVYSRNDESGSFTFTGGSVFPPASGTNDSTTNALSAGLRHVWRDSGWYALAGVARSEFDGNSEVNGVFGSGSYDTTAYTLGVGKYLGDATAVDLSVFESDTGGFDQTNFALTFSHIGAISTGWQYGADIAIAKSDESGDDGFYSLRGSLYPSPKFEFGIGFSRQQFDYGIDQNTIEGFASLFVRDNVEISANYHQDSNGDFSGQDIDDNQFNIGVNVRF